MGKSTAQKLRIAENASLLTINAPSTFKKSIGELPDNVKISTTANKYDQVHWFVKDRTQVEKEMAKVLRLVKENVILWIYYPKGTSGIQTDLTRDKGWDKLLKAGDQLTWISLISFDDTWSVFGCRQKNSTDKQKDAKPTVREIFNWVNPATKEVRLPDDLAQALKKNKKEAACFESLSFTGKKEFIEWIITAKREETRSQRLKETIIKLSNGWKSPTNR